MTAKKPGPKGNSEASAPRHGETAPGEPEPHGKEKQGPGARGNQGSIHKRTLHAARDEQQREIRDGKLVLFT